MSRDLRTLRQFFRPGLLGLFALTLTTAACGKKGDTTAPGEKGMSVEEADRKRAEAQKAAKADTLVALANKDLASGRWASARDRAKRALEAESKNADAYAVLGAASWRAGDYVGSTKAFKEALELDRKNFGAAVGLGRNYQAAAVDGRIVQIATQAGAVASADFSRLMVKRLTHTGSTLRPRTVEVKAGIAAALEANVWPLLAERRIAPVMDMIFPLKDAWRAHERMEEGDHVGKIVLDVE